MSRKVYIALRDTVIYLGGSAIVIAVTVQIIHFMKWLLEIK